MSERKALLLGSTGLVGSRCLQKLLNIYYFDKVTTLVRTPSLIKYAKQEQHAVDFDKIEQFAHLIKADIVFCCLGTTMKKAGSRDAFYKVDYSYVVKIAEIAFRNGCAQFFVISALGANPASSVFYNKVKGELELALRKIPFKCLAIFRPSILITDRREFRWAERIGILLVRSITYLLWGPVKKYRGIRASTVANAMIKIAKQNRSGIHILESDEIEKIGNKRH